MRQRLSAVDSIGYAIKTIVIVVKPFYHFILGIEGLDNAQPAQSLLYDRHQHSPLILPFERTTFQFSYRLVPEMYPAVGSRIKTKRVSCQLNGEHGRQQTIIIMGFLNIISSDAIIEFSISPPSPDIRAMTSPFFSLVKKPIGKLTTFSYT